MDFLHGIDFGVIITNFINLLIIPVLVKGMKWLNNVMVIQKENVKNLIQSRTLDKILDVVETVVLSAEKTIVKEYKAKTEDGKLTKEEANEIFIKVKDDIMKHITDEDEEILKAMGLDVQDFIEKKIHMVLKKMDLMINFH